MAKGYAPTPRIEERDEDFIHMWKKELYGLKQACISWHSSINSYIKLHVFVSSQ